MWPSRLVVVAVAGETVLALVAAVWIWTRGLPVEMGGPARGLGLGLGAAALRGSSPPHPAIAAAVAAVDEAIAVGRIGGPSPLHHRRRPRKERS